MVNIGQIPGQVPEGVDERVQENVWSFIADILFSIPDVLYCLAELLVSIL